MSSVTLNLSEEEAQDLYNLLRQLIVADDPRYRSFKDTIRSVRSKLGPTEKDEIAEELLDYKLRRNMDFDVKSTEFEVLWEALHDYVGRPTGEEENEH